MKRIVAYNFRVEQIMSDENANGATKWIGVYVVGQGEWVVGYGEQVETVRVRLNADNSYRELAGSLTLVCQLNTVSATVCPVAMNHLSVTSKALLIENAWSYMT